ncbi:MAG: peptidoglycan-binding domain-containing protein [Rickettsiales bacterium]|nr:peptidoglycan-binding domain-containing protein [Rickettsiales bacterium]
MPSNFDTSKTYGVTYDNKGKEFGKGMISDPNNNVDVHTIQDRIWDLMEENPEIKAAVLEATPDSHKKYLANKSAFIDGNLGTATTAAIKGVQNFFNEKELFEDKALVVDGVWGDKTRAGLTNYNQEQDQIWRDGGYKLQQSPQPEPQPSSYATMLPPPELMNLSFMVPESTRVDQTVFLAPVPGSTASIEAACQDFKDDIGACFEEKVDQCFVEAAPVNNGPILAANLEAPVKGR